MCEDIERLLVSLIEKEPDLEELMKRVNEIDIEELMKSVSEVDIGDLMKDYIESDTSGLLDCYCRKKVTPKTRRK